jgi:hypothetical protein
MCRMEQLPRVDLKKRLLRNIDLVDNAGADLPDDADVLDAALNDTPLDGDFLRHEANHLHKDDSDQPTHLEAYNEIFTADTGIARRNDRPTTEPTTEVHAFVTTWYMMTVVDKDPVHELGTQPPGFSWFFEDFVLEHLPAKLDLDSWVGDKVMNMFSTYGSITDGAVYQWRPWMGTNEDRSTPSPPGFEFLDRYVSFFGTPGEGRLVWRKNQWGVPKPTSLEEERNQKIIEGKLRRAEENLVRFSIRIANWLAWWLVNIYAYNIMHSGDGIERRRLTASDIPKAVIEILGDEWFKLPFDHEGKLKSWKCKRDIRISNERFTHIIRDGSDSEYSDGEYVDSDDESDQGVDS